MDIFSIIPASSKPLWWLIPLTLLLFGIFLVLLMTTLASQNSKVELDSEKIKIQGWLRSKEISLSKLNISDVELVDLDANLDYRPKRRALGVGVPGYAAGWFRLRNGEKALLNLTTHDDVVYIPTHEGYSLLLSIKEPQRFIERLKSIN